jgi:hypothetical protein
MMPDIEKVINELVEHIESALAVDSDYVDCVRTDLLQVAVGLLKEQEAVKPTWSRGKPFCGACGLRIHGGEFCSKCGKPILWEGR